MPTITYTGSLVITTCWCGISLAIPEDLYDFARRRGHAVYCPLGHTFVYTDTIKDKLKAAEERANRAEQARRATRALLEHEERSHAATRGHLTRKRKQLSRVKAGVCPCCNRTFQNLARHLAGQHPDYQP